MAEAMRRAGYAETTISSHTSVLKRQIQEPFQEAMVRRGYTVDAFLDKLGMMLEAQTYHPTVDKFTPDNHAQFKALKLWADLAGFEPPKKLEIDHNVSIEEKRAHQTRVWENMGGLS